MLRTTVAALACLGLMGCETQTVVSKASPDTMANASTSKIRLAKLKDGTSIDSPRGAKVKDDALCNAQRCVPMSEVDQIGRQESEVSPIVFLPVTLPLVGGAFGFIWLMTCLRQGCGPPHDATK